jgi:hypothetical protein
MHDKTLEALWEEAPRTTARFDPAMVSELPAPAQRYLLHTFAPGAPLASAARLAMHGELRLKGVWHPFEAEQVLSWDRGFVWRAHAKLKGLPVSGYDRLIDGEGAMRWRFLGIIPFMRADGPDITRSAAGRMHAEAIWFPAVLLGEDVQWLDGDLGYPDAADTVGGAGVGRVTRRQVNRIGQHAAGNHVPSMVVLSQSLCRSQACLGAMRRRCMISRFQLLGRWRSNPELASRGHEMGIERPRSGGTSNEPQSQTSDAALGGGDGRSRGWPRSRRGRSSVARSDR